MAIRNFLRKAGDKAKLIALVGGLGLMGVSGCRSPQGAEVKAPSDGIVDVSERKERVKSAADMDTAVGHDNKVLLGLLNDDEIAMSKRMKDRGLKWSGLGGLHVHASEDLDGLKKRYKYCAFGNEMPGGFGAFYCDNNDTVYLVKSPFTSLVNTFYHERGHHSNGGFNPHGHIVEIPAEAMRIYSCIFRRAQDMATGTMLGRLTFSDNIPQDVLINSANDISRYQIGVMSFFMEANNQGGDLDRALHSILHAGRDKLNRIISGGLDRNAGFSARETWFNEIGYLLNSKGFLHYLESLGMQKGEDRTEAEELVDYFKIMAMDSLIGQKSIFGEDNSQDISKRNRMLEGYLQIGISAGFFNPNFRNRVIGDMTKIYRDGIVDVFNDRPNHSIEEAIALADKIIQINSGYPCGHDEFACSKDYSGYRTEHLDAYLSKMYAHYLMGQKEGVNQAADSFLEAFCPGGKLAYSQNSPILGAKLIQVLERAYGYNMSFAYRANSDGNIDEYNKLRCEALGYLRKLEEATCYHVMDEALRKQCYDDSGIGATEMHNSHDLGSLESELEGICQ